MPVGWVVLHVAIAAVGTWLARRYALARKLMDEPGDRRSHAVATPRGGGIAIVIASVVGALAVLPRAGAAWPVVVAFAAGMMAVALVGWMDDHRPLSARLRLAVHVLAAAGFAAALGVTTGQWGWAGVAFVAIVVLVNVWNFMDGIDALAASQAALVAAAIGIALPGLAGTLAWAVAAGCLGFLPFNLPRARIFMGDVGSGALGFALAALFVVAAMGVPSRSLLWLLPPSAFLVDAGLTLLRRIIRREAWWTAHSQHAYQCWARRVGHGRVTLAYAGWTVMAMAVAWWLQTASAGFIVGSVMAWYTAAAFLWAWLQVRDAAARSRS